MADAVVVSGEETSDISLDESEYIPSESSDDSDTCVQVKRREENKGVKKRLFPELRKQQSKKIRRNSGKSYINTAGKKIKKKVFKDIEKCCSRKCYKDISLEDQKKLHCAFWNIGNKETQDTLLLRYLPKKGIKQKQMVTKTKNRDCSWSYSITLDKMSHRVCKSYILKLFQISEKRLRTVQNKLKDGNIVMKDMRGKHGNRPHKIPANIFETALMHLSSIPHRTSHYSSKSRTYVDNPDLTVKKLYHSFQQYYFEQTRSVLSMKYCTYHKFFRERSPFSIKHPRSDVCDFCAECTLKLSVRRAMFYAKYKQLKEELLLNCKTDNSVLVFEFDYAQNLPLPKLSVTSQLYKRLLWMFIFNAHCQNDGKSAFYWFLEHVSKKNPNTVVSFLNNFLLHYLPNENVTKVVLFSDSCGGQNKNITVVKYCSWLASKYKIQVEHIFPVRGHSFNVCDRNFGLYGSMLKRVEEIHTADEYIGIFKSCRSNSCPFLVVDGKSLLSDWSAVLSPVSFATPQALKD